MKKNLEVYDSNYNSYKFEFITIEEIVKELSEKFGINIGSQTKIGDGTKIGYGTNIGSRTNIGDGTNIGSRTKIGDGTKIGSRTNIGDGTNIGDNENIIMSILITGSKHAVLWWQKDAIQIGCKIMSISDWKEKFEAIGKEHQYQAEQIMEYGEYIKICENLYTAHLFIVESQKVKA